MDGLTYIKRGYILLAKKIQKSKIYHMRRFHREIWVHLLINTCFKQKQGKNRLERGQLYTSYAQVAEDLHWFENKKKCKYTHKQIENAFKTFRNEKMIVTEQKPRGLIITICNYKKYQNFENYNNQRGDAEKSENIINLNGYKDKNHNQGTQWANQGTQISLKNTENRYS
ncbi:MAG: hypothetical protein U9P79_01475 [Candidatus Cloacimonadota bacterium]|nr:hypothetical protein [Candidatus Cloacimonadota bacterium]